MLAAGYVHQTIGERNGRRFAGRVDLAVGQLAQRTQANESLVRSAAALFSASERVSRDEFATFVSVLQLELSHPDMLALGYVSWLPNADRPDNERFEKTHEPYLVKPDGTPPQSSVVMIEPAVPMNLALLGADPWSDPTRRPAMARCRDTGDLAWSGKVDTLVPQTAREGSDLVLCAPVYDRGAPTADAMARRRALVGWVQARFRLEAMLASLNSIVPAGDLEIYAIGMEDGSATLLHDRIPDSSAHRGDVVEERRVPVAGGEWLLVFDQTSAPVSASESVLPFAIFLGGASGTLLTYALLLRLIRGREQAELANEQLRRAEEQRLNLLERARIAAEQARVTAENSRFLADATTLLASALASPDLLERVARRAVPFVGDGCTIDLLREDGTLERSVLVYRDPEHEEMTRSLYARLELDEVTAPTIWEVLREGKPRRMNRVSEEWLQKWVRPELQPIARRILASFVAVPLIARERTLGVLGFSREQPDGFSDQDLELALDLGRRVAISLDNARLYANAQEAIRVREEFLSVASHELRTPLTTLQAQLQGLERIARREEVLPSQVVLEKTLLSLRQMRRLAARVHELLDVARISKGPITLERTAVDLRELAEEMVRRFATEASRAGCELRLRTTDDARGLWDRDRVAQILEGLLSNAIKYGAGAPVDIEVQGLEDEVLVRVRDRGIGIPEDAIARIFERFERAASGRHYGGLGLGLFLSRQIARAHGGDISVVSEPGNGSTFTLRLPREPSD